MTPCAFCGGVELTAVGTTPERVAVYALCDGCGATGPTAELGDRSAGDVELDAEAFALWDVRVESTDVGALRSENARLRALVEADHDFIRLFVEKRRDRLGGGIEGTGPLFVALAAEARVMFDDVGAANYLEIEFGDDRGKLSVLIQRAEGETPAFRAARLERELKELQSKKEDRDHARNDQ